MAKATGTPLRGDPIVLGLVVFTAGLVPLFLSGSAGMRTSWGLQFAVDLITAGLALRLAGLNRGQRYARRFWRSIAITISSCAIGDGYQTVQVLLHPERTDVSLVQTGFVVGGLVITVGTMLVHPLGGTGGQRLRLWLDTATVLTAVAVFLWYYTLAEALSSGDSARYYGSAAASTVMLLIAFGLLKLVLSGTAPFAVLPGTIGSLGAAGAAVGTQIFTTLLDSSDSWIMYVVQLLPPTLIALSLRLQEVHEHRRPGAPTVSARWGNSRLPYVAVIATQLLLIVVLVRNGPDVRVWGVTAGTAIITTLVLSRQLAAFKDNERLVAELDRLNEELRFQADHDPLTGLANRARLDRDLHELPAGSTVSLLLVDLDGFKPVNDQHGHQAGDEVLKAVAGRLSSLAGIDGTAARLGGDEFVLLLPDVSPGAAAVLAELVAEAVATPIPVGDLLLTVGASIGVAAGSPADAERIMREADAAMYRTKAARKSIPGCTPSPAPLSTP